MDDSSIDPTQRVDQSQIQQPPDQPPQQPPQPDNGDDKYKNINLKEHPFAEYFVDHWGWSVKDAMKAEDQFFKMIEHQCTQIMNRYKNIYKQLNPEYQDQ